MGKTNTNNEELNELNNKYDYIVKDKKELIEQHNLSKKQEKEFIDITKNSNKIFNDELEKVSNILDEASDSKCIENLFNDKYINNTKGINTDDIDKLENERNEMLNKLKNNLNIVNDNAKFDNTKLFKLLNRIQPITYNELMDCLETDKLDYPENTFDNTLLYLALLRNQYFIAKKLFEKGVFINYNIKLQNTNIVNITHNENLLIKFLNMYAPDKLYDLIMFNKFDKIDSHFLIHYIYVTNYNIVKKLCENGIKLQFKNDVIEEELPLSNIEVFYNIVHKRTEIVYNNEYEKQIMDNLDYVLKNDKLLVNEKLLHPKLSSDPDPADAYISLSKLFSTKQIYIGGALCYNGNKMTKEVCITSDKKINALEILFNNGFNLIENSTKFSDSIIYDLIKNNEEDIAIYLIKNHDLKYEYPIEYLNKLFPKKYKNNKEYLDSLIYSIKNKLFNLANFLLDKNIKIDTSIFKNAFYYAIKYRNFELAKRILNKVSDKSDLINKLSKSKDYKYTFKYSYLYKVLSNCDYDFALYLIKEGANITFKHKKYFNNSLLYYAIRRCDVEIDDRFDYYITIKDYSNINDPNIKPPSKEQIELVKVLLEHNIQITYNYNIMHNITVLQYIEKFYPTEIIELVKKQLKKDTFTIDIVPIDINPKNILPSIFREPNFKEPLKKEPKKIIINS